MSSTATSNPHYCYNIVLPKPLLFLVSVVDGLWLAITKALFQVGLVSSPTTLLAPPWDHAYVSDLTMHQPKNNLFTVLPVMKFSSLRKSSKEAGDCKEDEAVCGVCLSRLEEKHEVRELGNCYHGFHMECMDKWVNLGHLTCPLCRAHLLPSKFKRRKEK